MPAHRSRPLPAWIACLAVVTGALAPAIGQAVTSLRGWPLVLVELCSARPGARLVAWTPAFHRATTVADPAARTVDPAAHSDGSAPRTDGPAPPGGAAGVHCPACPGPFDPWGLPGAQAPPFAPSSGALRLPGALGDVPAAVAPAWTPGNPRAPPGRA